MKYFHHDQVVKCNWGCYFLVSLFQRNNILLTTGKHFSMCKLFFFLCHNKQTQFVLRSAVNLCYPTSGSLQKLASKMMIGSLSYYADALH